MRRKNRPDKWRRIRKLYTDIKEGQSMYIFAIRLTYKLIILSLIINT